MNNGGALWLKSICTKNAFEISDSRIKLLEKFVDELLSWNQKINLISRKNESMVWQQHILGSIAFLFHHQIARGTNVLDLGTGGGLPGIPLAILLPDVKFTLVDSINKKILAVEEIVKSLQLPNAKAVPGRAEELVNQRSYKQSYDYVIARAVAPVEEILRWGRGFLKGDRAPVNERTPSDPAQSSRAGGAGDTKMVQITPPSILLLKGGEISQEIQKAKLRFPKARIEIHSLVIDGIQPDALFDKKLVIAQL